jgi:hypothetical protein
MNNRIKRCTAWVAVLVSIAAGICAAEAQPKDPPPSPDGPKTVPPSAAKRPPEAPSNVRITVQRYSPADAAGTTAQKGKTDPSSLPTGRAREPVAAALDAQNFAPALRAASVASRSHVVSAIESRLASAETALSNVEKSTSEMSDDGRREFRALSDAAKERAKALRQSVEVARRANENEWDGARAQLAADYHAYAASLARIDSVRGVAPPVR